MYYDPYFGYRMQEQSQVYGQISESSIQPQTLIFSPGFPSSVSVGGCIQKWATIRLKDERTLNVFVTFITQKSLGGFRPNGHQIALNLNEIMEMVC